jgi:hypothetical protein
MERNQGNDPRSSAAFEEAKLRRADLHASLIALEEAISSPASGRLEQWTADVTKRLGQLLQTIDEHIEVTERPGGLYEEIRMRAPRLSGSIDRLHDEHPLVRETTRDLVRKFESTPIGEARDEVQRLLGKLVRHRQDGADLVWEAYNLDIGGHE